MKGWLRSLYSRLKRLSDVLGVFLTLIGVPAALVGAYTFSGEITDSMTAPDIRVSVPRITLRCFLRFTDQKDLNDYRAGATAIEARVCGDNWLAIGFLATFENQDRIVRTITDISAVLRLPEGAPAEEVVLDLPWFVSDEVVGLAATNVRRTFDLLRMPPRTTLRNEIWISQTAPVNERIAWKAVRAWIAEGARPGQKVGATIRVTVADHAEAIEVATCEFVFAEKSLETFRGWTLAERRAFTGACA